MKLKPGEIVICKTLDPYRIRWLIENNKDRFKEIFLIDLDREDRIYTYRDGEFKQLKIKRKLEDGLEEVIKPEIGAFMSKHLPKTEPALVIIKGFASYEDYYDAFYSGIGYESDSKHAIAFMTPNPPTPSFVKVVDLMFASPEEAKAYKPRDVPLEKWLQATKGLTLGEVVKLASSRGDVMREAREIKLNRLSSMGLRIEQAKKLDELPGFHVYKKLLSAMGADDAAVPDWGDGKIEPLVSVARRVPLLEAVREALLRGELKVGSVYRRLRTRYVDVNLLSEDPRVTFLNVNTRRDLELAESLCARAGVRSQGCGDRTLRF